MARSRRRRAGREPVTVEQVALNVTARAARLANQIRRSIYANRHGHSSEAVLAALGGRAAAVTDVLAAADAIITP
jgi:hypothetical protein